MAHEVFISYAHLDKHAADAACSWLERAGIRCWIAPRDVQPGSEWADSIVRAIGNATVFILVFSGEANSSRHVAREVELAIKSGQIVVPFRIEPVEPKGSLLYYIGDAHWLDAIDPPFERHLTTLAETLSALLGQAPAPMPEPEALAATPRSAHQPETTIRSPPVGRRRRIAAVATVLVIAAGGTALALSESDDPAGACDNGVRWAQTFSPYADGQLIVTKDDTGAAVIQGGARLNFPSPEEYEALVGDASNLRITRSAFDALGTAPKDGLLLRERADSGNTGPLFLSAGGAVFRVRDTATLRGVELDPDAAIVVPSHGLDGTPRTPVTGTLLRRDDSKSVWVIDGGARRLSQNVCAGARINVLPADRHILDDISIAPDT